jgi:hypothetical protein
MWRSILVYAIRAAVASGLVDKAKGKVVGWLKRKLAKSVVKLEDKVNAQLEDLEKKTGVQIFAESAEGEQEDDEIFG